MKATSITAKYSIIALTALLITMLTVRPAVSQITAKSGKANKQEQFVSIDFNNVDINVFIKFMSELTGTNFVVDQRVKGKVTIISPAKISLKEAYKVFESVLEVHGFTTVQSGELVKIIPSPDARSKSSVILAYPPTNILIITDVYSNIKRLIKILNEIDITGIGQQISVIPVEYAEASKLVNLLTTVFKPQRTKGKTAVQKAITMVADERTNTIVMLASEVDSLRVKRLIHMIDKETPRGKGSIHVYYCKHATAEELAKVLQDLPSQQTGGKAGVGKAAPSAVAGKVRISADKSTNSLIIMADKEDFNVLEGVIEKLDIPRPMVYIESLIMEVDASTSFNIGIDWSIFGEATVAGKETVVGGGFRNGFVSPQELLQGGLTVGLLTDPVNIAGIDVSNISAIINAVQTDDDFRILSTPQILTTDNEEARIYVGENRPYQTRSTTDDSGGTFESFEYRDVGKTLKITPHVTEGRLVRMLINLEVTAIDQVQTLTTSSTQPVTLKRTVDTTVIVKDQQTVVIGGLIDDVTTEGENKVPVLGDIPVLGWMFRKRSEETVKTNLYVFLTPRVIKNPGEALGIFQQKRDQIETIKEGEIKYYEKHSGTSEESITVSEPNQNPAVVQPRVEPRVEPRVQPRVIEPR